MTSKIKLEKLPNKLCRKIYKTGQTRGADDSQIYQNRVSRNSTVLIPFNEYRKKNSIRKDCIENKFQNGYIVLIHPDDYFNNEYSKYKELILGKNMLVFFRLRSDWEKYHKDIREWVPAKNRHSPLGGEYVARIPATTAKKVNGKKIYKGFTDSSNKGAGIRLYEYSDKDNIERCRLQLEAIFWLCKDAEQVVSKAGMTNTGIQKRKEAKIKEAKKAGLLDTNKLIKARIIDDQGHTICPLCLKELSAEGFISNLKIPEGREVPDLTVTQNNLFHIEELKYGVYNHRPYNLGWGHHYCNVVAKDTGIQTALNWMKDVLKRNELFNNDML